MTLKRRPRQERSSRPTEKRLPVTERLHPAGGDLDRLPAETVVQLILREDAQALHRLIARSRPIARAARAIARSIGSGGRLFYVGAGTSGRLGALDAAEWPPTFGIPASRVRAIVAGGRRALGRAVEGAEDRSRDGAFALQRVRVGPNDVVCGITASGGTPFVIGALERAGKAGATRVLITANPSSPAPCEIRVLLDTGPEILSGSTRMKAAVATHAVLQTMSTAAMALSGRIYAGRMIGVRATNRKLRERARRILAEVCAVSPRRAAALVSRAGGEVDVAIVMEKRGVTPVRARAILRRVGSLRAILEGTSA